MARVNVKKSSEKCLLASVKLVKSAQKLTKIERIYQILEKILKNPEETNIKPKEIWENLGKFLAYMHKL